MNLFTLTGRILVNNEQANASMAETDGQANNLANNMGNSIKKVGEFALQIGAAFAGVASAVGGMAIKVTDDFNGAINSLQVQTGAANEELVGMEESLKNIYANNFGESFDDIANSMATIKTQTDLSGESLELATENALMLRDAFEFEVNESTRAANQLMKEFGLTAEEAYTLIAQGAQSGLNANDDLLDTINEYSVHFEQLGFDAEEMFNMLENGATSGTFSIDKLGDAVKEFGIRAKDGSDTTSQAFELLGLDADGLQVRFAQGGESASMAFDEVTKALIECDDKVAQNIAGVNLFGTMFEDLGVEAIAALTDVNGEFDKTKNTMESINEIKYNDIGSAFEGLKRMIEVDLLLPLGQELMPVINNFINTIKNNMPQIKEVCKTTIDVIIGAISGLIENLNTILPIVAGFVAGILAFKTITTVSTIITTFSTLISGAGSAMAIFNAICAANPIILIAIAIGAVIAALVALIMNFDEVSAWLSDFWESIKELFSKVANVVSDTFSGMWETVKEVFGNIVDGVKDWFTDLIDWFKDLPKKFIEIGKNIFTGMWDGIKGVWNDITSWVSEKVEWLVDKITFWDNGSSKKSTSYTNKSVEYVNGSHADGLAYVPFDGYIAELHQGETVLTKQEADKYRNGGNTNNTYNVVIDAKNVKEFNDIVDMCNGYTQNSRMGV